MATRATDGTLLRNGYAIITGLIGITQVVFNWTWIGKPEASFESPAWLVIFEVAWTFVSFLVLLALKSESWRETPISRTEGEESSRIGAEASAPGLSENRDPEIGTSECPATGSVVRGWAVMLAGSYVIYGSSAVLLTQVLANQAGTVTETMVPEWWKIVSVAAGLWFLVGSIFLMRKRQDLTAS